MRARPRRSAALTGPRVFLRQPTVADRAEFLALNRVSRHLHRGLAAPPTTAPQFAAFLKRARDPARSVFLICRHEDDAVIGSIALGHITRGLLQSAFVGYYVGAPFARQGYMTEALELMLRRAFVQLKLHRLEANIQPGNRASLALVRRAGFTREGFSRRYLKVCGRWCDHERWAILVEDWRARKKAARVSIAARARDQDARH